MKKGFSAWLEYTKERGKAGVPFLRKLKGKKVLDMGCGDGVHLALNPKNWVGIDINENTVRIAMERGYNVVQGSVTECPFEDGSFDAILAYQLIEHLNPDDAYGMLSEMKRLLKKGGIAYITSPLPPDVWKTFTHIKPYHPRAIQKILTYEVKETKTGLKGLKLEYVVYFGPRVMLFGHAVPLVGAIVNLIANITGFWRRGYLVRLRRK
jgi:SAM-dependent methyltransferase